MAELTFKVSQRPEAAVVVELGGDAGLAESDALERHLTRLIAGQPQFAVIDLAGLAFIASMALGLLVHAHRAFRRRNGRLLFAAPQPQVLGVIQRCHLEQVLEVFPTVDAALAARE